MGGNAAALRPNTVPLRCGPWTGRAVLAVAWAAGAVALAQTAVGVVNAFTVESEFLNPDVEGSLFQLVTAAVTAAAGAAAAVHAYLFAARGRRFAVLAAILLYFAADDALVLHERLGEAVGEGLFGLEGHLAVRLWVVLLAPLLVAAVVLVISEARGAGAPLRGLLEAGVGALVAAVVVELAGAVTRDPSFVDRVSGKPETLRYLAEEALELGGWILIAGGLWVLTVARMEGDGAVSADARRP